MPKSFPLDSKGFNRFGDLIGLKFAQCENGQSCCTLTVDRKMFNPQQVLHGGIAFSMADTGMGAALYSLMGEGELCATRDIKISYFKSVTSGVLSCETRVTEKGEKIAMLESEIKKDNVLVAKATGTFSIFRR